MAELPKGVRLASGYFIQKGGVIARVMNPRLRVIQKIYVPGRDIGIEHLRQDHYIGGDEKK